jgi:integrase
VSELAVLASTVPAGIDQDYLLQARQMQALSFAVHIPLVCFGIAFPTLVLFVEWLYLRLAEAIGERYGPMIVFAAATGLRPAEWIALENRDVDRDGRVIYVRRSFTKGELNRPKTDASLRAVPLQARALDALERLPASKESLLLFPGERGGYLDIHHFRPNQWRPAQIAAGIDPLRRIYDLRHTFATFSLRAGISTFDLSRYMGAGLTMIDRHYGHLARDGREHAIHLLDALNGGGSKRWTPVDAAWTSIERAAVGAGNGNGS